MGLQNPLLPTGRKPPEGCGLSESPPGWGGKAGEPRAGSSPWVQLCFRGRWTRQSKEDPGQPGSLGRCRGWRPDLLRMGCSRAGRCQLCCSGPEVPLTSWWALQSGAADSGLGRAGAGAWGLRRRRGVCAPCWPRGQEGGCVGTQGPEGRRGLGFHAPILSCSLWPS